ncbi:MAG: carbamoyl-phosphate synthase large subunit, partial [Kiritimatiellia bacterium]
IVCSIENLDPMGIHTGDSITVAPIQTLTDREYQAMRDDSLAVLDAIGISTGGSNVQWAVNPRTGRRIIIEMNPRVSRSSALASKATGFPIAKIAALLAVGYTLDELRNDITRETPSCFEPALDYVVVKVPRFTFEKFPAADPHLGTQMKSVGEAMAIGRTFEEAFQKALRSLETKHMGFGADEKSEMFLPAPDHATWDAVRTREWNDAELAEALAHPGAERIFQLYEALRRGWTVERLFALTAIDRWFLRHLDELQKFGEHLRANLRLDDAGRFNSPALLAQAKAKGFSDAQIAYLLRAREDDVRAARRAAGVRPRFGAVDTCAGEFRAVTPYYYSTNQATEAPAAACAAGDGRRRIMVLGGGPNRIGQGIEFDYCCCHAAFALRARGCEVIMVNSNPETVSTDYDTSDRLYFEPLTLEDVMEIYDRERCDGVIVQFGGQTPLNLAQRLRAAGARVIGTSPDDIDRAEDRDFFKALVEEVGMHQPPSGIAHTVAEAVRVANDIGYPVLVRPSFVLGGRGMAIVYREDYLVRYVEEAVRAAEGKPILIDKFLEHAVELDVDCISDGETTVVGAILEHVEPAGCHSGDSASVTPPRTLSAATLAEVRRLALEFARRLRVCGLMNLQLAVTRAADRPQDETIWMIEVNPRASRTIPFVSKAIGVPLAGYAARCMAGEKLAEIGFTEEVRLPYTCVKEAVFPFVKFPGVDVTLTPEMKSTGEVMAIDADPHIAFFKSQLAAGSRIPQTGSLFLAVKDEDKDAVVPLARRLDGMGYAIYATRGTSTKLWENGIKSNAIYRISRGRPNVLDLMREKRVDWIVSTSEPGAEAMVDDIRMRSSAVVHGVPISTTVAGFEAAVKGLEDFTRFGELAVCTLQEYHAKLKRRQ